MLATVVAPSSRWAREGAARSLEGGDGRCRSAGHRSWFRAVACAALIGSVTCIPVAEARRTAEAETLLATMRVADLPVEGRDVLAAIHAGGPFVSRRDGIRFGNREGILPARPRGYYAEYTVPTPGAHDRGARRIIAGRGTTGDFRSSNEYYFTNDHYQSFRRILQ